EDDPPRLGKWQKRHEVSFDVRDKLYKLVGVDLFPVPGLNAETLMTLYSEVGGDMGRWPSEKHFTSWLSLCPGTKISGGKDLASPSLLIRCADGLVKWVGSGSAPSS